MVRWHSGIFLIKRNFLSTMSRPKKIFCLFDVDGTLTAPRKDIDATFKDFLFNVVKPKCALGVIGGSDLDKITGQLGGTHVISSLDYLFSENGLVAFKDGKQITSQTIQKHLGEEKLQKFINAALRELSEVEIPLKRGTFIEFRTGMINISPIGRSCSQSERDAFEVFDKEHKVRQKIIDNLKSRFPDSGLIYSIGGQISFDVVPEGWDKTYALNLIDWESVEELHFFGDRTDPGGNDHEIYNDTRVIGHKVTSPEDTKRQLCDLLNL